MRDLNQFKNLSYNSFYRGLVVDNNDPDKKGRIRIKVYPMFDEIDTEYIPWAVPARGIFDGAGNGFGNFSIPSNNSFVWVFFEAGDIYQPVYFAEAATAGYGTPASALTNYPNRKVFRTSLGTEILIDSSGTVQVTSSTGAYVSINSSGDITLNGVDITIEGSGDVIIKGATVSINPL